MQVTNNFAVLYPVRDSEKSQTSSGFKVDVEIYGTENKVERCSTYSFHPFKTGSNLASTLFKKIYYWFYEFCYGKTAVLVKVQDQSAPLYMKVDELSRILKIPQQTIQKKAKEGDVTDFLVEHQIRKTGEKIQQFVTTKMNWIQTQNEHFNRIIREIGYKNAFEVIDHDKFDSVKMALTLLDIGQKLLTKNDVSYEGIYELNLQEKNIEVCRRERFKIKSINLLNLTFKEKDLLAGYSEEKDKTTFTISRLPANRSFTNSGSRNRPVSSVETTFDSYIQKYQMQKEDGRYLNTLAQKVGHLSLNIVLESLSEESRLVMMNTFARIGSRHSQSNLVESIKSIFRLTYVGKSVDKVTRKPKTFAFAISKKNIFIAQESIDAGSSKIVHAAILLNNLKKPYVRIKRRKFMDSAGNKVLKGETQHRKEEEMKAEANFLEEIDKQSHSSPYIVPPFICQITAQEKKSTIYIQEFYLKGEILKKLSFKQQLKGIRDIGKGLGDVHAIKFVHCDLKLANILVTVAAEKMSDNSEEPIVALTDFGMTVPFGAPIYGGTLEYLPPEALKENQDSSTPNIYFEYRVNEKIDAFSWGVTALEILDELPKGYLGILSQENINAILGQVRDRFSKSEKDAKWKLAVLDVIQLLLKEKQQDRLSCQAALSMIEDIISGYDQKNV